MNAIDVLKWTATVVVVIGTAVNSLGYYPLGPLILVLSGFIWIVVSIKWKEPSLVVTNVVITAVAIAGLIYRYFN